MAQKEESLAPVRQARGISPMSRLFLYVHAAGRCEFDGCNEYLLEHYPTGTAGNFGGQAHIFAFNEAGPRGAECGRPEDINSLTNLTLLCSACHHLVDTNPTAYPVSVLRKFKRDHEDRVRELTGLSKDRDTVPLVLRALVAGRPVGVSDEEMQVAVAPNYLRRRDKVEIDLTGIPDTSDAAFWNTATACIEHKLDRLHSLPVRPDRTLRISVFALGPIPLLVNLGARLSDKIEVELYQRHRNPETWEWHKEPGRATYVTRKVQKGTDPQCVALLLNLSGSNKLETLPDLVDGRFSIYETTLVDIRPSPLFLRCRSDLDKLHHEHLQTMSMLRDSHPKLAVLHLFPAIPAPVAVMVGRSRLPKVDPTLRVYDRDKRAGGFVPTLEVESE